MKDIFYIMGPKEKVSRNLNVFDTGITMFMTQTVYFFK